MFTPPELVSYLLQAGLLTKHSIVNGDLVIADVSRRNRNFKVTRSDGPSYLVKQGAGDEGAASLAREASVYRWLEGAGDQEFLPHCYHYDEHESILVIEYVRDSCDLREHYVRSGKFSREIAEEMARALAALHRRSPETLLTVRYDRPWAASLHQPDLQLLTTVSTANVQLLKILQKYPDFSMAIQVVRDNSGESACVHFDIKADNWIVLAQRSRRSTSRVRLVDWELAGLGDPCWDIGSVFSDYLTLWLESIPVTGSTPPERFPELARYPLSRMHAAIGSFWRSYCRARELDAAEAEEWLARSMNFAAIRLLQTAFEQADTSIQLTGSTVCFLQLSMNILQRPREASVHLLGLPPAS